MRISVISGGFDPIHSGHISYIKAARELGDYLIVALNSDEWLIKKKGKFFMDFNERKCILENLTDVDEVISFKDDEKGSCIDALNLIKKKFKNEEILFCNGGDRTKKNIPEMIVDGVDFRYGIGGDDKKNSSSSILKKWSYDSEKRVWGEFYNLYESRGLKVKELIVLPSKGMSFQRHFLRNEIWFVSEGKCLVNYSNESPKETKEILLSKEDVFFVKKEEWHQITNPFDQVCKLIEIQYGENTVEEDIERLHLYKES
tara:strand:- start:982 stop:1755 length:774 start_codon:yes stop_codon:yes gene_type:complete